MTWESLSVPRKIVLGAVLSVVLAGCTTTHVQTVEDAAAAHALACEIVKTAQLTPEEQKAVDAACAVRCEPAP